MIRRRIFCALTVAAVGLAGCETAGLEGPGYQPPPPPNGAPQPNCPSPATTEARVEPSGPEARLNGRLLIGVCGLLQGDQVTTGPGTKATIRFRDGTTFVLAPNTDPFWDWSSPGPGRQGTIRMRIDQGLSLITTGAQYAVDWVSQQAEGLTWSKVVVEAQPGLTAAYLFEGHLRLTRPQMRDLLPMQEVIVARGGVAVRPISPEDQARLSRIFGQRLGPTFRTPPPPPPVIRPPPPPPVVSPPPPPPRATTPPPSILRQRAVRPPPTQTPTPPG